MNNANNSNYRILTSIEIVKIFRNLYTDRAYIYGKSGCEKYPTLQDVIKQL